MSARRHIENAAVMAHVIADLLAIVVVGGIVLAGGLIEKMRRGGG